MLILKKFDTCDLLYLKPGIASNRRFFSNSSTWVLVQNPQTLWLLLHERVIIYRAQILHRRTAKIQRLIWSVEIKILRWILLTRIKAFNLCNNSIYTTPIHCLFDICAQAYLISKACSLNFMRFFKTKYRKLWSMAL